MFRDAYLVSLTKGSCEVPAEFVDIASDVRITPDTVQLIYRDALTAFKVAAATNGSVCRGNVLPETGRAGGLHFPGRHVFSEPLRRGAGGVTWR